MNLSIVVEAPKRFDIYNILWRRLFDSTNLASTARVESNKLIKLQHFGEFFSVFSAWEYSIIWLFYDEKNVYSHYFVNSTPNLFKIKALQY